MVKLECRPPNDLVKELFVITTADLNVSGIVRVVLNATRSGVKKIQIQTLRCPLANHEVRIAERTTNNTPVPGDIASDCRRSDIICFLVSPGQLSPCYIINLMFFHRAL